MYTDLEFGEREHLCPICSSTSLSLGIQISTGVEKKKLTFVIILCVWQLIDNIKILIIQISTQMKDTFKFHGKNDSCTLTL